MIMSIIGPRETHDYRNYNLLVRGVNSPHPPKKVVSQGVDSDGWLPVGTKVNRFNLGFELLRGRSSRG